MRTVIAYRPSRYMYVMELETENCSTATTAYSACGGPLARPGRHVVLIRASKTPEDAYKRVRVLTPSKMADV